MRNNDTKLTRAIPTVRESRDGKREKQRRKEGKTQDNKIGPIEVSTSHTQQTNESIVSQYRIDNSASGVSH